MRHYSTYQSQFIEMFSAMTTTPVKTYVDDSFPGEWGTEDTIGDGVKVIRTTNFTNSGKLNLADVVTRSIEDRKVSRKQIKKYDTILERSGGTADNPVGRVVLFDEDGLFLCNNFTQVLRFRDIDPRFAFYSLYYFYQTNKTAIRSMGSKTTGIQNLNMSKYLEIGIPNASDEEQKEFVAIAEQADKSKFTRLKSQFIEMFGSSNKIKLGELATFVNGSAFKPEEWGESGLPIVRIQNLTGSGEGYNRYNGDITKKVIIEPGDILISWSATLGVYIWTGERALLNQHIFRADIDKDKVDKDFFIYTVQAALNIMGENAHGSTMKHVVKKDFDDTLVAYPSFAEQRRFSTIYKQADKSKYMN